MKKLFIDIETVPGGTFYDEILMNSVEPPGTISKPETIAQWWAEKGREKRNQAAAASALHPLFCRVICISFAINDGQVFTFYGDDEKAIILEAFSTAYNEAGRTAQLTWVGHNIMGFDLPVLRARCLVNDIGPGFLPDATRKPWDAPVEDTMAMMAGRDFKGYSLDNIARVLGMGGKGGMAGRDVWDFYKAGRHQEIIDYCAGDVKLVRAIYNRVAPYYSTM